ncbi:MAG: CPCC family cysteine-rich protein [Dehalococcoidia bacterium]
MSEIAALTSEVPDDGFSGEDHDAVLYRLGWELDPARCPVCGLETFGASDSPEYCPQCGWKDDPAQRRNPVLAGRANRLSLQESQAKWGAGGSV